jgi:hypothetical protein
MAQKIIDAQKKELVEIDALLQKHKSASTGASSGGASAHKGAQSGH